MKKWFYWAGLPACFILLVGSTFLFPKTYESTFVIAKETELSTEQNRVMTLNRPENYDLGVIRTDNRLDAHAYCEVLQSDQFLQTLLDMHVRTIEEDFDGTYRDYCTKKMKAPVFLRWMKKESDSTTACGTEKDSVDVRWSSKEEEGIVNTLRNSIKSEVDYETNFVSITCTSQDPLVSTMVATNVRDQLLAYIEKYQQEKMQIALQQLSELEEQAKIEYEQDPTDEKEQIYKSFARQLTVFKAQMMYQPSFVTLAEPSFSYKKSGPNRWKMPLLITLLLGIGFWCWDNKKMVKQYLLG